MVSVAFPSYWFISSWLKNVVCFQWYCVVFRFGETGSVVEFYYKAQFQSLSDGLKYDLNLNKQIDFLIEQAAKSESFTFHLVTLPYFLFFSFYLV